MKNNLRKILLFMYCCIYVFYLCLILIPSVEASTLEAIMDYDEVSLCEESLVLYNYDNIYKYELDMFSMYKINKDEKLLNYVAIYTDELIKVTLIVEYMPYLEIQLNGYTIQDGDTYIFSTKSFDVNIFDRYSDEISYDTSLGYDLYHERDIWYDLYTKKFSENYVETSRSVDTSYIGQEQLDTITKDDSYISSYNDVDSYYISTCPVDDRIVSIIPKTWFFDAGTNTYVGDEYFIYTKTVVYEYKLINWKYVPIIYQTQVFIYDYDYKLPNTTNSGSGGIVDTNFSLDSIPAITMHNEHFYMTGEPLLNEIYFCLTTEYNYYDIYEYYDDLGMVLKPINMVGSYNIDYQDKIASNLYFLPFNLTLNFDSSNDSQSFSETADIDFATYNFDIYQDNNESYTMSDAIYSVSEDVLMSYVVNKIGTISDLFFPGASILANLGYAVYLINDDLKTAQGYENQIFSETVQTGEFAFGRNSDNTVIKIANMNFSHNSTNYVNIGSMNYINNIKIYFNEGSNYELELYDLEISTLYTLYDHQGNMLVNSSNGSNEDGINKYLFNVENSFSNIMLHELDRNIISLENNDMLNFTFDTGYAECVVPVCIESNSTLTFNLSWSSEYEIGIYNYNGSELISYNIKYKYYTSLFLPCNDLIGEIYFVKVKHLTSSASSVSAKYEKSINIWNTTSTISISDFSLQKILFYVPNVSELGQIFSIETNSWADTKIEVFDIYGGKIGESDNPYLDASDANERDDLDACVYITNNVDNGYYILVSWDKVVYENISITIYKRVLTYY